MAATEFGGEDHVPANVQPKPSSQLTASERLRLTYLTGQSEDSRAPRDPKVWKGQISR